MAERLAIHGGTPVRAEPLPYARQSVDDEDVRAVVEVLRGDSLTTGPHVDDFERAFASVCGVREAVAVSSGTAALHATMHAIGLGPGDELVVPAMTFAASANAALYVGARPVFADVEEDTLLIDPAAADAVAGQAARAIMAVDYAGQPCDYRALRELARRRGLRLVADACHALGGTYDGAPVGSLAASSVFSLHPAKHVTAGEGGAITTDDEELAACMRRFRNHGISSDTRERQRAGAWFYEMTDLGYNYRITDFQCALAAAQLRKLGRWVERRREIAARYDKAFAELAGIRPLTVRPDRQHAYHLYVVRVVADELGAGRDDVFRALRAEGIGCNVHYVPVHLHPYYRERLGTRPGMLPVTEKAYDEILTLPLFPAMTDRDADDVVEAVAKVVAHHAG